MKKTDPAATKKLVVRSILIVLYIALALAMAVTGKRHSVLIDNKDAEDGSYQAVDGMSVQIDGLEAAEYYPGDRDQASVKGPRHRIKVEVFADGQKVEKEFRLSFGAPDMVLLSVPKMLAGKEPWIEPFSAQQEQVSQADAETSGAMSYGGEETQSEPAQEAVPAK